MFRRSPEAAIEPIVELSTEESQRLIDEALSRVETVEGVDYLDGYTLPPDNYGLWEPRTLRLETYEPKEEEGKITYCLRSTVFESTMTNAFARKINVLSISRGLSPLFKKWSYRQKRGGF
jgi:hypothetical protein